MESLIGVAVAFYIGHWMTSTSRSLSRFRVAIKSWVFGLGLLVGLIASLIGHPDIVRPGWDGVGDRLIFGMLLGVLTSAASALVIPLSILLGIHFVGPPLEAVANLRKTLNERHASKIRDRLLKQQQIEFERQAPLRDVAAREAQAERRRRDDAHASALLSFSFYSAKLGDRFSREMFDEYVRRHMGDEHPVETVEKRGRELVAIFEKHLLDLQPTKKTATIESLTRWYEDTKAQIEAMDMAPRVKEVRLIDLLSRFNELLAKHIEENEP